MLRRRQPFRIARGGEAAGDIRELRPRRVERSCGRRVGAQLVLELLQSLGKPRACRVDPREQRLELADADAGRGDRRLDADEVPLGHDRCRRQSEVAGEFVDADAEGCGIRAPHRLPSMRRAPSPRSRRPRMPRATARAADSIGARSASASVGAVERVAVGRDRRRLSLEHLERDARARAVLLLLAQRLGREMRGLRGGVGLVGGIAIAQQRLGPVRRAAGRRAPPPRSGLRRNRSRRPGRRRTPRPQGRRRRSAARPRRAGAPRRRRRRRAHARRLCGAARARSGSPRTCACRRACAAVAGDRRSSRAGTRRTGPARAGSPAGTAAG